MERRGLFILTGARERGERGSRVCYENFSPRGGGSEVGGKLLHASELLLGDYNSGQFWAIFCLSRGRTLSTAYNPLLYGNTFYFLFYELLTTCAGYIQVAISKGCRECTTTGVGGCVTVVLVVLDIPLIYSQCQDLIFRSAPLENAKTTHNTESSRRDCRDVLISQR